MNTAVSIPHRQRLIAFLIVTIFLLATNWAVNISSFPYDSGLYWELSKPSTLSGFPDTYRGYLWPYLLMPVHALENWMGSDSHYVYRITSSLAYSALLTSPVADFFKRCFGGQLSISRRTALAIATMAVFPGLFLYPLSDLPAVILLICGILLADSRRSAWWSLACVCSGALVAAAYNTRTIYIVSFAVVLVLIPLFFYRGRPIHIRALATIYFLLGAAIILLPQAFINKQYHEVATPLVLTGAGSTSLMVAQLYWGLTVQRYETSIQPKDPAPGLFYADPAGLAFNANHPAEGSPQTITAYIKSIYTHPLFFIGLYGRHFVNGIDVRDGTMYTEKSSRNETLWPLFCLTLFIFCAFVACTRTEKRWTEWCYLSPLIIAIACIIPGAIETRFLMPLYLILFGAVTTRFEWAYFRGQLKTHWPTIISGYILTVSVLFAITSSTMAQLQFTHP